MKPPSAILVVLASLGLMAAAAFVFYRAALPELYTGVVGTNATTSWTPEILQPDSPDFLPDFSFAGYDWGESVPPTHTETHSVLSFGAIPDDGIDDTKSFIRALQAIQVDTGSVVLAIPTGRFILRDVLFIERSNLVIQGNSEGGSTLFFPDHLSGMANEKADSILLDVSQYIEANDLRNLLTPYSQFAWSGGVIWVRQPAASDKILTSATAGSRGKSLISVESVENLVPGMTIQLEWYNRDGPDGSLLKHVLGPYDLPIGERLFESPEKALIRQPVTIQEVRDGQLVVKEPLLHDIRPEWTVRIRETAFLHNIGIENLTIEFPDADYGGHHLDKGFNGIYLSDLEHSWLRNIRVRNADSAILTMNSKNVSVSDLHISGRNGHHSVYLSHTYGFLVTDFNIQSGALHNPSFNTGSTLSVFSHGRIHDAVLDQHGGLNHQNLYDDLQTDNTKDLMNHGGAAYWKPTAGRFNTFWNIVAREGTSFASVTRNAPEARIVGLRGPRESLSFRYGPSAYVEGLNRKGIAVESLYEYQLEQRLSKGLLQRLSR